MGGTEPAWDSPPLLAALRPGAALPTLARSAAAAALSGSERLVTAIGWPPPSARGPGARSAVGPVLFAYDGSRLAMAAIAEAGRQLPARRDALVLTVWRTFNVGFIPEPGAQFDAACAGTVEQAAEQTAAHGAAAGRGGRILGRGPGGPGNAGRQGASSRPPRITTPASSSSAPTAGPGSAAWSPGASPPRSPPTRSGRS